MSCCPPALTRGRVAGGGGASPSPGRDIPFRIGNVTPQSTSVFPVLTTLVSVTIPAGALATDGDMIEVKLGGNCINAGAAGGRFNPFIGIDASFGWGTQSINVPNVLGPYPWWMELVITRKSATSYALVGTFELLDFNTALTGIGDLQQPNPGGPIASPQADPACDWSIAQQLIFNMSATLAGTTFRVKSGYVEILAQ